MCRRDKVNYYLDIAETASERSTCLKRKYGAVIVKEDSIIASGFNGAPRGVKACIECNKCHRQNAERGMDYSNCVSVHAEQNAIIAASRTQMINSTLYLVGLENNDEYVENPEPCSLCKRMIINSGIEEVIVRIDYNNYKRFKVEDWKNTNNITGGY